jgi:hypothetical protein
MQDQEEMEAGPGSAQSGQPSYFGPSPTPLLVASGGAAGPGGPNAPSGAYGFYASRNIKYFSITRWS